MLLLGPLGFAAPWLLVALIALPVLWVILRATPPAPRRVVFPGVALLAGLRDRSPVARRTPLWLLLLRLAAVASMILALAGPVWRPTSQAEGTGPVLVVLDAGWAAAPDWPARQLRAERALQDAARAGRPAALLLADGRERPALRWQPADAALAGLRAAVPVAWPTGLPVAPEEILPDGPVSTLWISDGADHPAREVWLRALQDRGNVTVVAPAALPSSLSLAQGDAGPVLSLHGAAASGAGLPAVLAIGPDPQGIERVLARLTPGAPDAQGRRAVSLDLPPEQRNRVTRFQIEGAAHAGAVVLADDRVRRRKVALVAELAGRAEGQQLLSPAHYVRQALAPHADVIEGSLGDVLDAAPDVVILVDQVQLAEIGELAEWVDAGGLLIRFAGPRMAAYDRLMDEPLLPVALRQGGRDIGGALSWGDPRGLSPFARDGVFGGLSIPADVQVRAQLMAQPSPDLGARTIATLSDMTPLVTRDGIGQGQVALFHVSASPEWSNLPLSGLFVEMLQRLVATARSGPATEPADPRDAQFWTPREILDGFGRSGPAEALSPVPAALMAEGPGPDRPAGIYQAGERVQALNAGGPLQAASWPGARLEGPGQAVGRALRGPLLALAAILLALDALGTAWLGRAGRSLAVGLLLGAGLLLPPKAPMAQELRPELIKAAGEVALAYVVTGDDEIDRISRQGLRGLSLALSARSSVEPGPPVGVDLDRDELAMLTFLYWPVTEAQLPPSPQAYLRLNAYLRSGGMIMFDTRDGDLAGVGGPDMTGPLRRLAAPLDIPPLAPVPQDHVLTRTFYLLADFPGRWQGNPVWVEAPPAGVEAEAGMPFRQLNDGVTPVVIGGNAWAEAWAIDDAGAPVFPVGRGWEGERQREMAYRFGINLIMYVLTGNYKSDQVHVPELLERLRLEEGLTR